MKNILLASACILNWCLTYSQTTFDQGDLAIIGVNANNQACSGVTAEDRISFVSFIPITSGTVLDFTDNGYERTTVGLWGDTEGNYRFTYTGATIAAGTIITFIMDNVGGATLPVGWTFAKLPGFTGNFNINSGGDQIYITQGGTWTNPGGAHDATFVGGRFLAAFNTFTTWNSLGSSTQRSALHPSCTCVSFVASSGSSDFLLYTGSLTSTNRFDWYLRLTTTANWTAQGSCATFNTNFATIPAVIPISASISTSTWTGAVDNNWFNCQNWNPARVPNEFTNVIIPNVTNNPIISATAPFSDDFQDTARCNNVTMNGEKLEIVSSANNILVAHGDLTISSTSGSELDMSDGTFATPDGRVFLRGNWINNLTENDFKQGQSTIIFWGPNNQTITTLDASNLEVFYNLSINKSSGSLTLNDDIEVGANSGDPMAERTGVLTLTNRNLITGAQNVLITNPTIGGIIGGSSASFVDGNLRRQSNTINLYNYPCGEGSAYMRAELRTTSTNLTVMEVDAQNTGYGTYTPLEAGLNNVSTVRWWDVSKISGTSNVNVRLYWTGTPASNGITNVSDLVVAHWSSYNHSGINSGPTQWWNRGRSIANSSGLVSDGWVEGSEVESTFSPHTFASLTSTNPLPVELLSFDVNCNNGIIDAKWQTASETNNHFFEIQGSSDAITYHVLQTVLGAGNSNSLVQYQLSLDNLLSDQYFRLQQVDFDGTSTVYPPLYLDCRRENMTIPLTISGSAITVILPNDIFYGSLNMFDVIGKNIYSTPITKGKTGNNIIIPKPETISSGIYIISLIDESNGQKYNCKFFIH